MVIKYCPHCSGHPYTKDTGTANCPVCGTRLYSEMADESALFGRPMLDMSGGFGGSYDPWSEEDTGNGLAFGDPLPGFDGPEPGFGDPPLRPDLEFGSAARPMDIPTDKDITEEPATGFFAQTVPGGAGRVNNTGTEEYASAANMGTTIRGKIFNYSNTDREGGRYPRFFITRIIDALAYGQRTEDLLHRFNVQVEGPDGDYTAVPVNVHGTISGGMQLADNQMAEVSGTYRDGILMARRIDVISGGLRTTVRFQRSPAPAIYGLLVAAILGFLVYIGISGGGTFFGSIGQFLTTWAVIAVIITVLYLILFARAGLFAKMFLVKHGRFPLIGILLVSLLLTLVYLNSFGLGAAAGGALSGLLSALLPMLGTLAVIGIFIWLIRSIFR